MQCACQTPGAAPAPATSPLLEILRELTRGQAAKRAGMCPQRLLQHCTTMWGAKAITLASGATGTLKWDTVGVFFSHFWPVAGIINVTAAGKNSAYDTAAARYTQTVNECCLNDLIDINQIEYQGQKRLASSTPVNLETFDCCDTKLGLSCLGPIEASSNDLTIDVGNIADPAAVTFDLRVTGTLVGFEVRNGDILTAYGKVPCGAVEEGNWEEIAKYVPGLNAAVEATFKANMGTKRGEYRPEG